jgi:hypothetical protein
MIHWTPTFALSPNSITLMISRSFWSHMRAVVRYYRQGLDTQLHTQELTQQLAQTYIGLHRRKGKEALR